MSAWRALFALSGLTIAAVLLLQALDTRTAALRRDIADRDTQAALRSLLPPALSGPSLQWWPFDDADPGNPAWRLVHRDTDAVMAVIVTASAQGYSGDIVLQVAVDREGRLLGSRLQRHHETPAYAGDLTARWQADPNVDQLTGATITARAITAALDAAQQQALQRLRVAGGTPR